MKQHFLGRYSLALGIVVGCSWIAGCDQVSPTSDSFDPISVVLAGVVEADPDAPALPSDAQPPQDPQDTDSTPGEGDSPTPDESADPEPAPSSEPLDEPEGPDEPQGPDPAADPADPSIPGDSGTPDSDSPAEPQNSDTPAGADPDPTLGAPTEPATAEFFVDAQLGDDANSGVGGWANAWQTLGMAMDNAIPGCVIYLRGTFQMPLKPTRSGAEGSPIRIVGPATIDTQGRDYALVVRGISWYELDDLVFQVMNESLPDGSPLDPGTKQYSVGVGILSEGSSHNKLTSCVFINAGLGSSRACVEVMLESNYNVFDHCVAICERVGDKSFGRRAYLIFGSSFNQIVDCVNHGPDSPGPDGSIYSGVGVGVTIYGGTYDGSRGIKPSGSPLPCVGNVVLRHTSYETFAYAFGFTAGYSWVEDNTFQDCTASVSDKAYAACYANVQNQKGSQTAKCRNNRWIACTVTGGTRGFWVNGMPGCRAENCMVLGKPGITRSGYELSVDANSGLGSFTVADSAASNVDVAFREGVDVEP